MSSMNYIVDFNDNQVKIKYGIDPAEYHNKENILVNPTLPRKAPPHTWKLVNGKIAIQTPVELEVASKRKPKRKLHPILVNIVVAIIVSLIFKYL